jgi:hypothetical protein
MATKTFPIAEVFGFTVNDHSAKAERYRKSRRCPYNNKVPNCTKDKANNPLAVCSILHAGKPAIVCPIRFRENWSITDDAAEFFFEPGTKWSSLTEVRVNDALGKSAGNIDVVLAAYDENGTVSDFGALEVQAVYISGNVRDYFDYYMKQSGHDLGSQWESIPNYPSPDFLSSSRKRLVPQLLFKGGIFYAWRKKTAVAINKCFLDTLPKLEKVKKSKADIAWLIYDLEEHEENGRIEFRLTKIDELYTDFPSTLQTVSTPKVGDMGCFVQTLQAKLDEQLETEPKTQTIERPF